MVASSSKALSAVNSVVRSRYCSKDKSNLGAYIELLRRHPKLSVAGRRNGYFQDAAAAVDQINRSGTDLLFVALGSPSQEFWIRDHRSRLEAPFCMGVGGSFDVLSGRAKWAPDIYRRTGTEFLYRLVMEPRRWRRQLCLPLFAYEVLKERFMRRQSEPAIVVNHRQV